MKTFIRSTFILALLILNGCSTSRNTPAPIIERHGDHYETSPAPPSYATKRPSGKGDQIYTIAHKLIGSPYRYGGEDPSGFDCSGLVQYSHRNVGIKVPRTANDQYKSAYSIPASELKPGDVIFFRFNWRNISHVGIYAGQGKFIHAPRKGKRVTTSSLSEPYWQKRVAKTGRFY
ncbi:MAG: C40 family peptidase [Gammaproteobacteria bacterium]